MAAKRRAVTRSKKRVASRAGGPKPATARRATAAATKPAPVFYQFHAVTPARWADLEQLFGPRGACAGCWCQYPRRTAADFNAGKGDGNRRALKRLVVAGGPVGVLAYVGGEAVGWCAVAPRADFVRLAGSKILAPVDERPVWAIPCQFVARAHRGRGLTVALLRAAVEFARKRGARIVEGYPVDTRGAKQPAAFVWWGVARAFEQAGFREVARRSATRPIMRLELRAPGGAARGTGGRAPATKARRGA